MPLMIQNLKLSSNVPPEYTENAQNTLYKMQEHIEGRGNR